MNFARRLTISMLSWFAATSLPSAALAQPLGNGFTYQGEVHTSGAPATGPHDFRFQLYSTASGGSPLGLAQCRNNIILTDGRFTTEIDFGSAFAGQQRFLQVEVRADTGLDCTNSSGFTVLSPRQPLTATPYSLWTLAAANATQLNGQAGAFYQNAGNLTGTLPGGSLLGAYGNALTLSNAANSFTGSGSGLINLNATNISAGTLDSARLPVPLTLSGTSATHIIRGDNTAASGTAYGGYFTSASTSGRGVFGEATATTGSAQGGRFFSASASGTGVVGQANSPTGTTFGVIGTSVSSDGRGVFGQATSTTGATYGGYFQTGSSGGIGVLGRATVGAGQTSGVYGESSSTTGRGVVGEATAATGTNYGGYFRSNSHGGIGVVGEATVLATGVSGTGFIGVKGAGNFGVRGDGEFGVHGASNVQSGRGVYGLVTSSSGTNYAVIGEVSFSSNGYGVYSHGDFGASGTKVFRIDHPDDPANKYLLHYAAESPEVINFYRGTVVLDGAGGAVVELPRYFAKINKNPSYQLTAVGAPMPTLHVAEEIDESALSRAAELPAGESAPLSSFRIAGGAPGAKVSWEVKAVRNDRYVQKRGAPVEVEKVASERGKYQHPELYGQPAEAGMNHGARGAGMRRPD